MERAKITVYYRAQQRALEPYEIFQAFLDFRRQLQAAAGPARRAPAEATDAGNDDPWPLISCLGAPERTGFDPRPGRAHPREPGPGRSCQARGVAGPLGGDPRPGPPPGDKKMGAPAAVRGPWPGVGRGAGRLLENEILPVDLEQLLERRGCS